MPQKRQNCVGEVYNRRTKASMGFRPAASASRQALVRIVRALRGIWRRTVTARILAPRARFELATLRLTAESIKNLSALSGVAYEKLGAIFPFLVAPTPAPTPMTPECRATEAH